MSDMGEIFDAMKELKAQQRAKLEPKRESLAKMLLTEIGASHISDGEKITIHLKQGTIIFWPYSGWFCGKRPLGKVKGRGVATLIKEIVKCQESRITHHSG